MEYTEGMARQAKKQTTTAGSPRRIAQRSRAADSRRRRAAGIRETGPQGARNATPIIRTEGGGDLYSLVVHTFFGRLLLLVVGIAVVIGLDILFSANRFERFTLILGIELIVAALVLWFVYLWRQRETLF